MNIEALLQLRALSREWAKTYAAVYDDLRREGVPDGRARDDARWAAHAALFRTGGPEREPWEK